MVRERHAALVIACDEVDFVLNGAKTESIGRRMGAEESRLFCRRGAKERRAERPQSFAVDESQHVRWELTLHLDTDVSNLYVEC